MNRRRKNPMNPLNPIEKLKDSSLKNKIFLSTLAVILLISVLIGLFTRWVLISSLTTELQRRGVGIAHSIAESSRGSILTENTPELTSLIFDARLGDRRPLVVYVFVLDKDLKVLSHTFTNPFPQGLEAANPVKEDGEEAIESLRVEGHSVYDVAVPVKEGIYQIGTIRVGLNKNHIDQLIGKLRITFLGFLSAVTIIFFVISHWLSKIITRPISELTKVSDEISRGNLEIRPDLGSDIQCWEHQHCQKTGCPAYQNMDMPCWYIDGTLCHETEKCTFPEKLVHCYECGVYKKGVRDEVKQLANSFINMTSRIKVSQAKLKESEAKYRSLFNSGPNPIFVLDRRTFSILDANPSAEATYGYDKGELIGRPFSDLGAFKYETGQEGEPDRSNWQRVCVVTPKVQHFKKGRVPFFVNVHACPARYQDFDAVIMGTTDITEMIEKDSLLIQASKMTTLGEMSAGIAHELNQPLNAIKMGSEFLKIMIEKGREIPQQDLHDVVTEMSDQVDRAAEIINHLRDFGRKADFTKEKVSINKPIQGVLDMVGKQLALQNIEVRLELDKSTPPVLAHNNRLEQVIFNLITNARDAINMKSETGKNAGERRIDIRSFSENGQVVVTVTDTGIGIPDELRGRIFEPFFTTKEMGEGMGLGLSITYGIVTDYDGKITIESEEGKGTQFRLSFPSAE